MIALMEIATVEVEVEVAAMEVEEAEVEEAEVVDMEEVDIVESAISGNNLSHVGMVIHANFHIRMVVVMAVVVMAVVVMEGIVGIIVGLQDQWVVALDLVLSGEIMDHANLVIDVNLAMGQKLVPNP